MNKQTEAMKLALEALKELVAQNETSMFAAQVSGASLTNARSSITALREALAEPDFWEGYVPEPDSTCNNALRAQGKGYPRTCKKCGKGPCVGLAQQALDKKAENARELGLDYEPAQPRAWFTIDELNAWADKKLKENPQWAEQSAQRTWVGLTEEERDEICLGDESIARSIEAKLREKNGGNHGS